MAKKSSKEYECPWTLTVDRREQAPWLFEDLMIGTGDSKKKLILPKTFGTLKQGDYSIQGYADKVAVERKSKTDLYSTLSSGRKRFVRELGRLNALDFAVVIVESDWLDCIQNPPERSKMTPASVNGTVIAFMQRFKRVHWMWLPGRYVASKQCFKVLDRWWKDNHG